MKNYKLSLAALTVAAALGTAMPAMANSGAIQGSSSSAAGTTLGAVTITIENVDTGLKRTVVSDASGNFRFPLLPAGTYKVVASKDGFAPTVQENVAVGISGKVTVNLALQEQGIERIAVSGSAISLVDVTSSNTGIVVDSLTIDKVPVPRDLTGVALLAPGTTKGDSAFGNLPSIGGASVAENAYFVNGLNLTNFRTGVGSSNPPFEMYESFEVKTGGYSAEFGRAMGGVINAKTKSGTNEFKWGVNAQWEPDALREDKPSQIREDGTYRINNSQDANTFWDVNIWASGAIIEDKLFFYTLYNPRSDVFESQGSESVNSGDILRSDYESVDEDAFWGLKLDWYINDDNILEFTSFSDKSTTDTSRLDMRNGEPRDTEKLGFVKEGGLNWTLKYTSVINDNLSISAQYGVNESDRTQQSALDANPAVYYYYPTSGSFVPGGNFANFSIGEGDDERQVFRIDADIYVGDHEIRVGVDTEKLTANQVTVNSGGAYYLYYLNDDDPNNVFEEEVRRRTYSAGGSFESNNFAYYIQDTWQVTDQLVLNLGLRNDSFENLNGNGEPFVKLDNQWAPRLGAVYDVNGDGESKIWASFGRYYLPVAANTNIRLSGAETYIQEFWAFNGYEDEALGIPVISGNKTRQDQIFSDGDVPDTSAIVDAGIDPMYSDEFILGYQFQLNDEWSMAIQANYRELGVTIEDVAVDFGLNKYLEREFGSSCTECTGFHYYVLGNPGTEMTITTDPDGDGPLAKQAYTIPAADLNYPESIRKYTAIDISVEKAWDGVWFMNAAYTWSKSEGNNEGYIRSDNGQDDAGLTTLFDQPGLLDGAYGLLPNDRTHQIKAYGTYQITENFNVGANFSYQSGRPKNAFGYHPTDVFAQAYGSESFYAAGKLAPRGSYGRTDSVMQLDLSASYTVPVGESTVTFRADVFNVFNSDTVTEVDEIHDRDGQDYDASNPAAAELNPNFGKATNWQTPRYVRLSASYRF
ncbi:TonB-dependent receptor [Psychrosphaera ytuae]|uniref:TonB-dependent receptor n=1 Tax=Psychrosphaera ytuae TaxID=2820710 RepID=A0A975HI48_9GAMM|nr:TonB-dependent receptor [Psychrosphaera ytuae]QTH63871.1 TonB-dependent receptor [Psychrosphaera ytuae]